jgi:large subunit ribosomal protein L17
MQKQRKGRKLGRETDQRQALLRSLASALILQEKIKTTEAKAKELAFYVERFITTAKKGGLTAQRRLRQTFAPAVAKKLVVEIAPRYQTRPGGYTRIIKLGERYGDAARMAFIELLK